MEECVRFELEKNEVLYKPFIYSEECSDEIVLLFDDGKKLYVSENLLSYASPVFKAMFRHDCKEKETREVKMKEKSCDDFLEFLLCLHPGVQKPVDNGNVLQVVSIAEEYQVKVSVARCQVVMKTWLTQETASAAKSNNHEQKTEHAVTCLNILTKAVACGYEELITYAIKEMARFGHEIFTGTNKYSYLQPTGFVWPTEYFQSSPDKTATISHPTQDCEMLFKSLPEEIKTRLLLQRLRLCDNGKMH